MEEAQGFYLLNVHLGIYNKARALEQCFNNLPAWSIRARRPDSSLQEDTKTESKKRLKG